MPNYQNTREILGDQAALDAFITHALTVLADDKIKTLRANAFLQQPLEEVYLPALETIQGSSPVFQECDDLKKIYIGLTTGAVCAANAACNLIGQIGRAMVFVPDDLVESYLSTTPWSKFPSRIKGVSHENDVFYDISEITDSWETIIARVNDGTAASVYKIGQYKTIDLYTEGQISFQIAGINADELADGSGMAQLSFIGRQCLTTARQINNSYSTTTGRVNGYGSYGGWKECLLRAALETDVLPLFPSAIAQAIKSVKKYSRTLNTDDTYTNNEETADKLWIPSRRELWMSDAEETSGPQYDLIMYNTAARIRTRAGSTSTYHLRNSASNQAFGSIRTSGTYNAYQYAGPNQKSGVLLGFCM